MSRLKVIDASGREWEQELLPQLIYTIGRSPSNKIVLRDPRASRHHAHIRHINGSFTLIDGHETNGELRRSVNRVFVNGEPVIEKQLVDSDEILVGASKLIFENNLRAAKLDFDDRPLGRTQLLMSADDLMQSVRGKIAAELRTETSELEDLRRKAKILELLYEMSKTLTGAFNLETIFAKATDVIFEATPADRVVALLKNDKALDGEQADQLNPIAARTRNLELSGLSDHVTISRTITHKVMSEGLALLSQDARTDAEFSGVDSIVTQGVRSTICAPLMTEAGGVHGAIYADRLDPFAAFTADDLALISAVAANTAVVIGTIEAHERLAREQVVRANYSRFLPQYVVQQLLEKPESFALGGTNQTVTVLFADIRGFTRLSEREKPEKVLQLLNRYFSEMTELIFMHGGTLDKYIGDGLMALFGAPTASPEDATNSVRAAIAMQQRLRQLNVELKADGFDALGIGIGLHTGEATVGYVGSERRSEYTAIGDTVNLAARLEANALAGQILMSEVTAAALRESFSLVPRDSLAVKNRVQTVPLFEVNWK